MKKTAYIIYGLLALVTTGLLVYDIFIAKDFTSSDLRKYIFIIIGIIVSIIKLKTGSAKQSGNKKKLYQNAYSEFIQGAFSDDPKLEKRFYLAVDDYNRNRPAKAIEKLEKLRKECLKTADIYAVIVFTALCYDELRLSHLAAEFYAQALNIRPNSTLASNLGLCYGKMGKPEAAINAYNLSIRIDPNNAYPWNNLAQLYIGQAAYEEALPYAEKAAALNSKMPQAHAAMAICHAMLGNEEEYTACYRRAVACGYDGAKLKAYIQALRS